MLGCFKTFLQDQVSINRILIIARIYWDYIDTCIWRNFYWKYIWKYLLWLMRSLEIIRKFKDLCAWLGVAAIIIDMYKHFQRFGTQTNKMHNNLDSAWAARLSVNIIIFFFILHFWCRSQWAICIIFRNFEIIYWYNADIKLARYFEIMKIRSHFRFYKIH